MIDLVSLNGSAVVRILCVINPGSVGNRLITGDPGASPRGLRGKATCV
jgi:hypothetical protein